MTAAALCLALAAAGAAPVPVTVEARRDGLNLTLVVPAPGTVDGVLRSKLKDGLTHRVRYTLTLKAAGTGTVLLTEILTTEVAYDLWDETFVVTHAEGGRLRRVRVRTPERASAILERPRFRTSLPLALLPPGQRCTVDVAVEINPISEEVLKRTREMLSPPPRDSEGTARSLLGSVARVFVNENTAGADGRKMSLVSGPFAIPPARGTP